MDEQIKLYSVDTKAFYTSNERNYHNLKMWANKRINCIKNELKKQSVEFVKANKEFYEEELLCDLTLQGYFNEDLIGDFNEKELSDYTDMMIEIHKNEYIKFAETQVFNILISRHKKYDKYLEIKKKSEELFNEEISNFKGVRKLNKKHLSPRNIVSLFKSALTRTMDFKVGEITNDIIILRPYHYVIFEQLVKNGYYFQGKHFIILTASAGQIRTKKCVFINEELWNKHEKTLLCGLTIEDMNKSKEGGMNLTKYMAYLALNNSATDEIEDFDIDRTIVVEDFETKVNGLVDYINVENLATGDIEDCIERKYMNVPITHSDGAGMILPKKQKRNAMYRLPWVKGLLTPCNYIKYCKTKRRKLVDGEWVNDFENYKITDIYGVKHDLLEENIEIIFTKSQFKAYKYYTNEYDENGVLIKSGWDKYKEWFKEYNCKANICNIEPYRNKFRQASLNYQMLQTSTDATDEEIEYFTKPVVEYITNGYTDLKTQLEMMKATEDNEYKNNLQTALMIYPEMIQESYCKSQLSDMLNKNKKQAKFGKFKTEAMYTFLIPDIYAWMEFMFDGNENPKGLLEGENEVSCKLYKDVKELVVNRSPHLYKELGVSDNTVSKETNEWFTTYGCYTSCHSLISKLLQFDNDGDKALVIADKVYYNMAKRNMEGIVPLYYEMAKAGSQIINKENLYTALVDGYKYGNVGQYSNKITVLWNEEKVDINAIKILTCLNNFYIDGAKTGYMPEISETIQKRLKVANGKLPYFFQFAKDKEEGQVKKINNSTVNRICKVIEDIPVKKYDFSKHGTFRYATLMSDKNIEINQELVDYYMELLGIYSKQRTDSDIDRYEFKNEISNKMKEELITKAYKLGYNEIEMTDIIVKYIYTNHKNNKKEMLWNVLGEYIIDNIRNNLKDKSLENGFKMCTECGKRVKIKGKNQCYCDKCSKKIEKQKIKNRVNNNRNK